MAEAHAKTAMEAARLAATLPEMRELALRELGAALALDPSHAGAVETLARLTLETPAELSEEARREFARSRRGTLRESRRGVFASYALWTCFFPFGIALGVRDRLAAGITAGCVALAAILAWLSPQSRIGGPDPLPDVLPRHPGHRQLLHALRLGHRRAGARGGAHGGLHPLRGQEAPARRPGPRRARR